MASKRRNNQHSCRGRLLGTLGAVTLAGCGGSGDVGPCPPSNSGGLSSVASISQMHIEMRRETIQLTLKWSLDDDITDLVNFVALYGNCGRHDACNDNDGGIYTASLVLTLARDVANGGYIRAFTIGLQL